MSDKTKTVLGVVLFVAFLAMTLIGLASPEMDIIFAKASKICLECIGVG